MADRFVEDQIEGSLWDGESLFPEDFVPVLLRVRGANGSPPDDAALAEFQRRIAGRDFCCEREAPVSLSGLVPPPNEFDGVRCPGMLGDDESPAVGSFWLWLMENWGSRGTCCNYESDAFSSESSSYPEEFRRLEEQWDVPAEGICFYFDTLDFPPLVWAETASGAFPDLELILTYWTNIQAFGQEGLTYFAGSARFQAGKCLSWETNNDEVEAVVDYRPPFGEFRDTFIGDLTRRIELIYRINAMDPEE